MSDYDLPTSNSERGLCISKSRHSSEHTPTLSPTQRSPLHTHRDRRRGISQDLLQQENNQTYRLPSLAPRPRSTTHHLQRHQSVKTRGRSSAASAVSAAKHESLPPRLSLDSQRTAINSSYHGSPAESRPSSMRSSLRNSIAEPFAEYADEPRASVMWSDEQLKRARRFSSSHIRGVSCPTLNITRIMRSISVSNINAATHAASRPSRHESLSPTGRAGPHSQQHMARTLRSPNPAYTGPAPALSVSRDHAMLLPAVAKVVASARTSNQDAATAMDSDDSQEGNYSNCSDIESRNNNNDNSDSDSIMPCLANEDAHTSYSSTTAADFLALGSTNGSTLLAEPNQARRVSGEGLRHRILAKHRDIGTPEIPILQEEDEERDDSQQLEEVELPLSPVLFESEHLATDASSTSSSARWSTISAEPPHKRYSYSSAAIAEALRNLESVERHNDIESLSAASHSILSTLSTFERPGSESGGETMTITLKAPHKRESVEVHQRSRDDEYVDDAQFPSIPRKSCDSRVSAESETVAIPAMYLDGTASLWDQYVAELQSSEFDPNIHIKRQRMSQFLRIPWNVEKLIWFGVAICIDALLYVFSILPAKFAFAAGKLVVSVAYDMPMLLESAFCSSVAQTTLRLMPASWSRRLTRMGMYAHRWMLRVSGRDASVSENGSNSSGHMGRWLLPTQLFDFYRGLLFIVTCAVLCRIDAAQMYHSIRAQSSLKLYFIFSTLDIFDRLLSSFGHDALDALQSTVTDPWSQRWKTGPAYFVLAQAYMLGHTLVLFYQMITLHVAVNSYSDQLLSLLISNQFVEIKSNVFKKWEKEMLFQISCADIVERFQQIIFLFLIILRNLAELSGSATLPLFESATTSTSPTSTGAFISSGGASAGMLPPAQLPVSFDKATPSAFGPLLPSWVSMPLVNRIITPILMVLGSEILIDWIKHAFVTKLNWIRPEIYSHYIGILSRDMACPKTGSRVSVKPPPGLDDGERAALFESSTDADEKIAQSSSASHMPPAGMGDQRAASSMTRPRSSSILVHTALKVLEWVRGDEDTDGRQHNHTAQARDTDNNLTPKRTHQKTSQSVTKPQLFFEQSTRVSRRLGLSPMPLACLIILVVIQVVHILVWPPRAHLGSTIASEAAGSSTAGASRLAHVFGLWIAGQVSRVPVLGTVGVVLLRACGWLVEKVIVRGVVAAAHVALHPWETAVSVLSVVFLDVVGWIVIGVVAYAIMVWIKLGFGSRLMDVAWSRYQVFKRQTSESGDAGGLKKFDDNTRKLDRDAFAEVGKAINKDESEKEWEKQRPKWTIDNIERFSLFKSRVQ
ncbi:hypothetical protein GGI11_001693 [Coemansia sp. RSA 2049]|nr:hypothetical protein GGI11_001693 [Coemansia sp. RSA 2049]